MSQAASLPVLETRARFLRPWMAPTATVLAVAAVIGIHIFVALNSAIPMLWTDELGYLANAQVLSGVGEPRDLAGRGYYVGWSLLITPLWWLTSNLDLIYQLSVAMSVVFGIATTVPLALIARRAGLGWTWSIALGAVVSLAPSRTSMSNFALAENFLAFFVALTVWLGMRFAAEKTVLRAVLFGASAAMVFVIHGRAIPVAIAAGLWFVWLLRRHLVTALAGGATLGAISLAGFLLYRWTISFMYPASADREATGIDRIFGSDPAAVLTSGGGQIWYMLAAWAGLTLLGGVFVARVALAEIRARRPGIATFSLITLVGAFVISATWVSRTVGAGRDRLDIYSYGRYLETYGPVLALFGLILIVKGISRRVAIVTAVTAIVITAVFFIFIAPQAPLDGILFWGATSVPGLLQWPWPHVSSQLQPPWYLAGAFALVALAAMWFLRKKVVVVVVVAAVFFAGSSIAAEIRTVTPYFAGFQESFGLRTVLAEYRGATVSFDVDGMNEPGMDRDTVSRNAYQYWSSPRPVAVFDSDEIDPVSELVIARKSWDNAARFGAIKIADDTGLFDNAIYVLPGALQRQLLADGVISE